MAPDQVPLKDSRTIALPERSWKSMFNALRLPDFRKYWICLLFLTFGTQLQQPAQNWLAYELTHSPFKLTLVAAMQAIPMLILSLYSGVIVDRVQKRNVIIATNSMTAVIAVIVATLIATGNVQYWHLLVASFMGGINNVFNMTARNSIVAELVPRERLYNSIALVNSGTFLAAIAGPAFAGILIGVIGTEGAYYFGAGFYVVSIFVAALIPATSKLGKTSVSMMRNLIEGLRYLRLQKTIILILVMELALTLFGMCYSGLMPVFSELLGVESEGYGFLLASSGIGCMVGSLAVAGLGNFKRKGLVLLTTGIIFGIALLLFANTVALGDYLNLGQGSYYLAVVLLIAVGIFSTAYTITSSTILQMNVSDEYRGRVTSALSLVISLYPVATLAVGAIAESLGAPMALTLAASALTLFMVGVTLISRRMRQLE